MAEWIGKLEATEEKFSKDVEEPEGPAPCAPDDGPCIRDTCAANEEFYVNPFRCVYTERIERP